MPSLDSFKEKAGPLPVYGWAVLITVLGIGIYYYRAKKNAANAPDPNSAPTDTTSGGPTAEQMDSGEIQAEYSLANQLALTQSGVANLATNVGKNSTAIGSNTYYQRQGVIADVANTKADVANTRAVNANTATIATAKKKPVKRLPPTRKGGHGPGVKPRPPRKAPH